MGVCSRRLILIVASALGCLACSSRATESALYARDVDSVYKASRVPGGLPDLSCATSWQDWAARVVAARQPSYSVLMSAFTSHAGRGRAS
jgi:hypothetical protein